MTMHACLIYRVTSFCASVLRKCDIMQSRTLTMTCFHVTLAIKGMWTVAPPVGLPSLGPFPVLMKNDCIRTWSQHKSFFFKVKIWHMHTSMFRCFSLVNHSGSYIISSSCSRVKVWILLLLRLKCIRVRRILSERDKDEIDQKQHACDEKQEETVVQFGLLSEKVSRWIPICLIENFWLHGNEIHQEIDNKGDYAGNGWGK